MNSIRSAGGSNSEKKKKKKKKKKSQDPPPSIQDSTDPPPSIQDATDRGDPTTGVQVIVKNEILENPVRLSSRGLLDLVTHVNKPTTVYTRQCSVSLPLGLGILPYGSPTADSSPPDMESLIGQPLAEIIEVSANFPFVGTIMVCDMRSSKPIYYKDDWDQTYYDFCSRRDKWVSSGNAAVEFKDKLELTGPSRATNAGSGFTIKVITPSSRRKSSEVCRLPCKTRDNRLYNQVKTKTMKTNRGVLYVTYSVLPDALEGFVKVLLQLPSHWSGVAGATVYGLITARIEKFDIGTTLFSKDFKEAVALEASPDDSKEGYKIIRVPLTRSVLSVPLGETLHVQGKLQVCGYDAMPITIDHRIPVPVDCDDVHTPWIKGGESLSAVRMWLSPIF